MVIRTIIVGGVHGRGEEGVYITLGTDTTK
jgi:hypothetical protein